MLLHLLARKRISTSTVKPIPNPIGGVVRTQLFFFKEVAYIAVVIVLVFCFVIPDVVRPKKGIIGNRRGSNRSTKASFPPLWGTVNRYFNQEPLIDLPFDVDKPTN